MIIEVDELIRRIVRFMRCIFQAFRILTNHINPDKCILPRSKNAAVFQIATISYVV